MIVRMRHRLGWARQWLSRNARRRWWRAGVVWRRSLQLRVVASTLALSAAVVFVLGMLLQSEITDRLMSGKQHAAVAQIRHARDMLQPTVLGVSPGMDALKSRMASALAKLSSTNDAGSRGDSPAGAFQPVLAAGSPGRADVSTAYVGPYPGVPDDLRRFVESGQLTTKIATVDIGSGRTTYLMVGTPVSTAVRPLQLYLLYPLTAERYTIEVVQSTLLVGGLVLVLLLAGIANLVTRQVVRPVRQAAEVAGKFADGHLEERMPVVGEDDVARLAESYNMMAASIAEQIRQLEEFGHLQRRFTSDVSHELRTPLTTVRMAADVLHASREQFPSGLSRSTELLVDELDRFESLLGDLLEISRLDAGVEELTVEQVDLAAIAADSVDSVRGISGNTELLLELPDGPINAEVDARRVSRILRNLLANAVDHSDGKPVRLIVAASEDAVALAVRDYGVGLRPGEEELVFNRFWRADPSRNRRTGGTGLGLAISLEDARLHGGTLTAWGRPGEGACFLLVLPRRPGVTPVTSPLPLPPPDQPAAVTGSTAPVPQVAADGAGYPEPVVGVDTAEPGRQRAPVPAAPDDASHVPAEGSR